MRHPIAVSLATKKWSKTTLNSLIEHWLICHEKFKLDSTYLKNISLIRYEEFVSSPQNIINKLFDNIGIESIILNRKIKKNINEKYFEEWRKKKKKYISKMYIEKLENKYKKRVLKFGYDLIV